MAIFKGDGANVFYEIKGDAAGEVITLINGYTRSSSDFKLMAAYLLEKGFRVLLIDNRGAGKSEHEKEFSLVSIIDDILGIWEKESIQRSHVLGISMGGYIAQLLAISHPQFVSSLCLVSTSMRLKSFLKARPWGTEQTKIEEHLKIYFHEDFAQRNKFLLAAMAKKIAEDNQSGEFDRKGESQQAAVKRTPDVEDGLGQVQIPTLVIHGENDQIFPLSEAQDLVAKIPHSQIKVFTQTGHLLLAEKHKEFYACVAEFFLTVHAIN